MKHMRTLALMIAIPTIASLAIAQGGLGRGRPGGGGGSGPSGPVGSPGGGGGGRSGPVGSPGQSGPSSRPSGGGLDRGRDRDRGPSSGPSAPTAPPARNAPSAPTAPGSRDRGDSGGSLPGGRDRGGSLDRGNPNGPRPGGDAGLGRNRGVPSRSGEVRYGTVNNANREAPATVIRSIPNARLNGGQGGRLPGMVGRQDGLGGFNGGFNNGGLVGGFGINNGWRFGYYHYNRGWCDDFFFYPHYAFNPWAFNQVCISPWYAYPFLPAYIAPTRVIFTTGWVPAWNWIDGSVWNWNAGWNNGWGNQGWNNGGGWNDRRDDRWDDDNRSRRNERELNIAIDDLREAFEQGDRRAISRLVPRRGNIAIVNDGRYDYSLNSEDFYDLLTDGALNAQTTRYQVLEVRRLRDTVRISARHEYTDPWNARQVVFHNIYMEPDRGVYTIREFGTSTRRIW